MDEGHRQRARGVKPTVALTTRAFNLLVREARNITTNPSLLVGHHEWHEDGLAENNPILTHLQEQQEAIQLSFESALSEALFRLPAEELAKQKGHAHILDSDTPETVGDLQSRLIGSVEYAKASLGQIQGLAPEAQQYALLVYVDLQNHLYQMAQEILSQPKVRGIP